MLAKLEHTVQVKNFEVFLISFFSWVADDTKIIHVKGGINTGIARNFPPVQYVPFVI